MKFVSEGILRGLGLMLPGVLVAVGLLYRRQHLTPAEHFMIASIIVLLVFCIIGYSVFHRLLWAHFGRITLFFFVTWVLVVACVRIADFLSTELTVAQIRLINTGFALFFTLNLTFIVWLRPFIKSIVSYVYGSEVLEIVPRKVENNYGNDS